MTSQEGISLPINSFLVLNIFACLLNISSTLYKTKQLRSNDMRISMAVDRDFRGRA